MGRFNLFYRRISILIFLFFKPNLFLHITSMNIANVKDIFSIIPVDKDIDADFRHRYMFNEKMKLADMLIASPKLLYVFPRFGIKLGFGEKSVKEICAELDLSTHLFLLVCNVYTYETFIPDMDDLQTFDLSDLLVYLHRSHKDYQKEQIKNLKKIVWKVAKGCGANGQILRRFFDEYIQEVVHHFEYEEQTVFPYVEKLLTQGTQKGFKIKEYEKNHSNIEEKLSELKNILIKYVREISLNDQRQALLQLVLFEDDLNRHALIEDRILVPLVTEFENKHK